MFIGELVAKISADVSGLVEAEKKARASFKNIESGVVSLNKTLGSLKGMFATVLGVVAVGGIINVARQFAELSDRVEMLNSRLRLVTKDAQEFSMVSERLYQIAQETGASYADIVEVYTRFANAMKDTGVESQKLLRIVEILNKTITVSGQSTIEAQAGLYQLSQALASGRLQGDELRSVLEQLPPVAQMIAKGIGVTVGQLRELASEGKITKDIIIESIIKAGEDIDKMFASMPITFERATNMLKNSIAMLAVQNESARGAFNAFKAVIVGLAWTLDDLRKQSNNTRNAVSVLGDVAFWMSKKVAQGIGIIVMVLLEGKVAWNAFLKAVTWICYQIVRIVTWMAQKVLEAVKWVVDALAKIPIVGEKWFRGAQSFLSGVIKGMKDTREYWRKLNEEMTEKTGKSVEDLLKVGDFVSLLGENIDKAWKQINKTTIPFFGGGQGAIKGLDNLGKESKKAVKEAEELKRIYEEVTLEALPRHAREVEEVNRKYTKLREEIERLVKSKVINQVKATELINALEKRRQEALREITKEMERELLDVLPKYERELAEINSRYDELAETIKELAESGLITQARMTELLSGAEKRRKESIEEFYKKLKEEFEGIRLAGLDEEIRGIEEIEKKYAELFEKLEEFRNLNAEILSQLGLTPEIFDKIAEGLERQKKIEEEILTINRERERLEETMSVKIAELELARKAEWLTTFEGLQVELALYKEMLAELEKLRSMVTVESEAVKLDKQILELQARIAELEERIRSFTGTFREGLAEGIRQWLEETKSSFELGVEIAKKAANEMQSAFSNFFFNVMTGQFKKLGDALTGFVNMILRAISDVLARMLVIKIFTSFGLGALLGAKEGGIFPGRFIPLATFAEGGIVTRPTLGLVAEGGYPEAVIPLKGGAVPVVLKGEREKPIELNIVNVADPGLMGEYLTSPSGESMVLNIIAKNNYKIKKILFGG